MNAQHTHTHTGRALGDCDHVTVGVSLTYPLRAGQPLVSQQEAVSVGSLHQVHGVGDVREAVELRHHRQDGHLPLDVARLGVSVDDEHRHRVPAPLHLDTHSCFLYVTDFLFINAL